MSSNAETSPLLRLALRLNAAFSTISGVTMLAFSERLTPLLGVPDPALLPSTGIQLLAFAALLLFLASRTRVRRWVVQAVIAADLAWVVGTVVVLALGVLTTTGNWAAVIVADFVLLFAILQYMGLRRSPVLASVNA